HFLALIGLGFMAFLQVRNIRGALLIGILAITAIAMLTGMSPLPRHWLSSPPSIQPLFAQLQWIPKLNTNTIIVILTFLYVALFDGLGTILAVSETSGISKRPDYERKLSRMLTADSISNMIGAVFGTSTVTAYIESATGISQGG